MPEFVNPQQILNQLNLSANMTAADFGCGSGGWTIPLAKILQKGKVLAVDIQEEPLSALESQMKLQGVSNIQKIVADVEEKIPEIKDGSCDLVLMTDLLFQIDDKEKVFSEAKRILKPKGKILVVEWLPNAILGPQEGRVSSQEVIKIAQNVGLGLEREFKAGDYHYGLLFFKP